MSKEIKTVVLLGAGGIGSYFIWGLSDILGQNFCVAADGERAQRLKNNGLTINGVKYTLNVKTPDEAAGCDLLIVAVKYYNLSSALLDIRTIAGPETTVISLLNGVDSEEIISNAIGAEKVLYSMIRFSVQHRGNETFFDPKRAEGLLFGEKDSSVKSPRVIALENLLSKTNIRYEAVPNIVAAQWKKLMINVSGNLPQAVFGVGYGAYFDSEHLAAIRIQLQKEVKCVADALHIPLELSDPNKAVFAPQTRFSTLQDLDNKKHTEIDMLLGVLLKKAKDNGVYIPYAEYTYHAIKVLEEKNDEKFDY